MIASRACNVTEIPTQRSTEEASRNIYSDLTSPTSNHIQDICIAVSVAFFFMHAS